MLGSGAKHQNLTIKKKRETTEEIIRILRRAYGEPALEEVCLETNISEETSIDGISTIGVHWTI